MQIKLQESSAKVFQASLNKILYFRKLSLECFTKLLKFFYTLSFL